MNKYIKVMFGNKGANFEYKIDDVNIANIWNPNADNPKDMGGFNFSTEDKIIRWLHRGDTLYDVIIPDDAEVIDVVESATPHGVFRSNKIIITNPRIVTDDMALEFYKKSNIPDNSYYKALAAVSVMGYKKTAISILKDKVNKDNIDLVLEEWNDFICKKDDRSNETVNLINEYLEEIKSELCISLFIEKDPYKKTLTRDSIINITGQSGSGKTSYTNKYFKGNEYLIIDTDDIFSKKRFSSSNGINKELGIFFRKKYTILPELGKNFDLIYDDIIDYCKRYDKTIVIDCAQFHCINDISKLKGEIVVLRTDIDTCYNRCINRYKLNNPDASDEDLKNYSNKKLSIYNWYKDTNKFIERINQI